MGKLPAKEVSETADTEELQPTEMPEHDEVELLAPHLLAGLVIASLVLLALTLYFTLPPLK